MEIKLEDIVRVYSGKPGCGCGCNGTYWEDVKNIKRVVNAILKMDREVESGRRKLERFNSQNVMHGMERVGVQDGFKGAKIYFAETASRYYWAYTAEER